jgi:hypothetical protein
MMADGAVMALPPQPEAKVVRARRLARTEFLFVMRAAEFNPGHGFHASSKGNDVVSYPWPASR